jgi:hypothetical protein
MALNREQVMWLMSAFDKPQSSFFLSHYRGDVSSWEPTTDEEKQALAELTAPENRESLREWYAQAPSINEGAKVFHDILEKIIGEKLPIGKK